MVLLGFLGGVSRYTASLRRYRRSRIGGRARIRARVVARLR
ncbi:hypothetical protein HRbin02_01529 [Candidatus Calditenuaceae archaeon HR02]|nr:hypothetical protein HRbin02_01529 [Candidatus Calditenuaceae archaeon HR02]